MEVRASLACFLWSTVLSLRERRDRTADYIIKTVFEDAEIDLSVFRTSSWRRRWPRRMTTDTRPASRGIWFIDNLATLSVSSAPGCLDNYIYVCL